MIRFIDIRNQGTGFRFSFWDTIVDEFIEIDTEYAWDDWEDFLEVAKLVSIKKDVIERYRTLCPEWVFNKEEDGIEGFYTKTKLNIE